ncbi:PorP/SprF family type IX secretion system membrane protein [Psychroserpens sp. XS_ASV72]|uniref:PorP/SprF family type IX secretion system membrane protein n=1 Tax=Psychroserpens sp. XS_ASV72 TaxID=3241293 RepID=UPI0035130CF6
MKPIYALIILMCSLQLLQAQEDDGVVALTLPVRNSLTFNRFAMQPTFSFVREQTKYISLYNKREWSQFEDAPLTYMAGYTGRFAENIGAGLSVFQQNYGVLTTFGGVTNFAYNLRMNRDSNLTFGMNIGAYKSGLNTGNVVSNVDDPALANVPENFLLTISPGINYGTAFIDFGVAINNLAAYNFNTSEMLQDNPEQGIQAHLMYTGYMSTRGFFDETKFSGLIRSEFKTDETVISALAMLTVPKGFWAQVGYNSVFGISGGAGINITPQIAIEYNFEKAIGDLTEFGPSHDITLAYRFKSNKYYDYSSEDEVVGLISGNKRKPIISNASKSRKETDAKRKLAEQKAKEEAAEQARLLGEQKAKEEAAEQARLLAEQKAKEEAAEQARLLAEQKAKEEAAEQARLLAEQKAKEEAEEQARLLAEQKAKEVAEKATDLESDIIANPQDDITKAMYELAKETEDTKTQQRELLQQFDDMVEVKNEDLKALKEENDLSEQGIAVQPRPFKSITEENNRLNRIKSNLDNIISNRSSKIKELKELYDDKYETDTLYNDEVFLFYRKTIKQLESEQKQAIEARSNLEIRLEDIKVATEYERRRRIKRAAFDNEEERYSLDRAALKNIKETTTVTNSLLSPSDFDFGEERSDNIQILKNVNHVDNGYYVIMAVHTDIEKRNEFVRKVVSTGESNVNFFYDVNTSKYYIYSKKYESIDMANEALNNRNKSYNEKVSLVKIEN